MHCDKIQISFLEQTMRRVFAILFFGINTTVFSQTIFLDGNSDMPINDKMSILQDTLWIKNTIKQEVPYGFDQHEGICQFQLQNKDKSQSFIIDVQQSRVDDVQLFVKRATNSIDTFPLINKKIGILDRSIKSVNFAFDVFLNRNEKVQITLKSSRKYGMHAPVITIRSIKKFNINEIFFTNYIGFTSGICFVISLAGIFLYFFFRFKMYFAYSLYCFCSFFLILVDSGYIHSYFPFENFLYLNNNGTTIVFYCVIGCHIFLTMVLLRLSSQKSYWLFRIGKYSSLFFIGLGLSLVMPFIEGSLRYYIIKISYYIVFFMDAYILIALISSIKNRQYFAYFYLVGFLFTLIGTTILILANIGIIDGINQDYDLAYSIPLVEIFCMLIGVSFQFSQQNKQFIATQLELSIAQKKVISIQDEEQRRIAQDLHDGIGQELLLLKPSLKNDKKGTDALEAILDNLRRVSRDLYPVSLKKMNLKEALESLCNQIIEKYDYFVSCEIDFDRNLSKEFELQIYRIVQEGINNAMKYAQATAIRIEILEKNNHLEILIKDNGIGFDAKKALESSKSFGLHSMSQRTKSLSGIFSIQSSKSGSIIHVLIPLENV